jgi:uncharacterized protein involved in outer membrane biogenesis
MKRWAVRIVTGLLALVLVVLLIAALFGGTVVKNAVNGAGPGLLGVPVTLKGAKVSLFSGKIRLEGLRIGNPEGYKTPSMFDLGSMDVAFKPGSIFSDTFVIEKILIDAPEITYERGLRNSNLGALLDQMSAKKPEGGTTNAPEPAATSTPAEAGKGGRKVVIDEFVMANGKINLSVTLAGGHSAPIAMETVTLRNIGREGGMEGVNAVQITRILVGTIVRSVLQAVGNAGKLVGDGLNAVGNVATEGVGAVGDAAAKGIESAGKAASQGVKAIGGALGGLLGGDKKKSDEKK